MGLLICILHIAGVSQMSYIPQTLSNQLISFKFVLIVHILPALDKNVNTNASKSLQRSYDHYKCLTNNTNDLQSVTLKYVANGYKYIANMLF